MARLFPAFYLYAKRGFNNFGLLLLVYFRITRSSSRTRLPADKSIIKSLEIHLQEGSGAHIQRLFLHPEPGGFIIFPVQGFQLISGQRIQLFHPDYCNIFPVVFNLSFGQVKIYFAAAKQNLAYLCSIFQQIHHQSLL